MNQPGWLDDRRWRWRVIVLIIMLLVVGLLFWQGHNLDAALSFTVVIFIVAAKVIPWIIDSPTSNRAAEPAPSATLPPADPAAVSSRDLPQQSTVAVPPANVVDGKVQP